jgi:hypothetical protein
MTDSFHNLLNKLTAVIVRLKMCEKELDKEENVNVGMVTTSVDILDRAINTYTQENKEERNEEHNTNLIDGEPPTSSTSNG